MGSKAPAAPDYASAAQATADSNQWATQYQTNANRPDMQTPWGTSSWSEEKSLDQAAYDRAMADWNSHDAKWQKKNAGLMPSQNDYYTSNWTNNVTLTPEQQASLDAQQQVQLGQSNLAGQLQGYVNDTMAGGFKAPELNDYMSGTAPVNTQFGTFNPQGPQANTNYSGFNYSGPTAFDSMLGLDTSQIAGINLNAPQFDASTAEAGTKAAYDANTALLRPQMEQDKTNLDAKLRLQGLTPGTQAYDAAMGSLTTSQGQQLNQIANQSVLTGNQLANTNYASQLAGFGAGNQAQGQQYGQAASTWNTNLGAQQLNNQAQQQNWAQILAGYNSGQDALTNQNAAIAQNYGQNLGTFNANMAAQQAGNQAAGQQYTQNMGTYGAARDAAIQNYTLPLNFLNAVLTGNQVQSPSFNGAPNSTAGNAGGTDYTGAYNQLGQYNLAAGQNSLGGQLLNLGGQLGAAYLGGK